MLKSLLLKYPLTLEEVDRLIIYMVYFNIDTIEELTLKTDEELEKNGEWTKRVKPLIQTVREHTPLK